MDTIDKITHGKNHYNVCSTSPEPLPRTIFIEGSERVISGKNQTLNGETRTSTNSKQVKTNSITIDSKSEVKKKPMNLNSDDEKIRGARKKQNTRENELGRSQNQANRKEHLGDYDNTYYSSMTPNTYKSTLDLGNIFPSLTGEFSTLNSSQSFPENLNNSNELIQSDVLLACNYETSQTSCNLGTSGKHTSHLEEDLGNQSLFHNEKTPNLCNSLERRQLQNKECSKPVDNNDPKANSRTLITNNNNHKNDETRMLGCEDASADPVDGPQDSSDIQRTSFCDINNSEISTTTPLSSSKNNFSFSLSVINLSHKFGISPLFKNTKYTKSNVKRSSQDKNMNNFSVSLPAPESLEKSSKKEVRQGEKMRNSITRGSKVTNKRELRQGANRIKVETSEHSTSTTNHQLISSTTNVTCKLNARSSPKIKTNKIKIMNPYSHQRIGKQPFVLTPTSNVSERGRAIPLPGEGNQYDRPSDRSYRNMAQKPGLEMHRNKEKIPLKTMKEFRSMHCRITEILDNGFGFLSCSKYSRACSEFENGLTLMDGVLEANVDSLRLSDLEKALCKSIQDAISDARRKALEGFSDCQTAILQPKDTTHSLPKGAPPSYTDVLKQDLQHIFSGNEHLPGELRDNHKDKKFKRTENLFSNNFKQSTYTQPKRDHQTIESYAVISEATTSTGNKGGSMGELTASGRESVDLRESTHKLDPSMSKDLSDSLVVSSHASQNSTLPISSSLSLTSHKENNEENTNTKDESQTVREITSSLLVDEYSFKKSKLYPELIFTTHDSADKHPDDPELDRYHNSVMKKLQKENENLVNDRNKILDLNTTTITKQTVPSNSSICLPSFHLSPSQMNSCSTHTKWQYIAANTPSAQVPSKFLLPSTPNITTSNCLCSQTYVNSKNINIDTSHPAKEQNSKNKASPLNFLQENELKTFVQQQKKHRNETDPKLASMNLKNRFPKPAPRKKYSQATEQTTNDIKTDTNLVQNNKDSVMDSKDSKNENKTQHVVDSKDSKNENRNHCYTSEKIASTSKLFISDLSDLSHISSYQKNNDAILEKNEMDSSIKNLDTKEDDSNFKFPEDDEVWHVFASHEPFQVIQSPSLEFSEHNSQMRDLKVYESPRNSLLSEFDPISIQKENQRDKEIESNFIHEKNPQKEEHESSLKENPNAETNFDSVQIVNPESSLKQVSPLVNEILNSDLRASEESLKTSSTKIEKDTEASYSKLSKQSEITSPSGEIENDAHVPMVKIGRSEFYTYEKCDAVNPSERWEEILKIEGIRLFFIKSDECIVTSHVRPVLRVYQAIGRTHASRRLNIHITAENKDRITIWKLNLTSESSITAFRTVYGIYIFSKMDGFHPGLKFSSKTTFPKSFRFLSLLQSCCNFEMEYFEKNSNKETSNHENFGQAVTRRSWKTIKSTLSSLSGRQSLFSEEYQEPRTKKVNGEFAKLQQVGRILEKCLQEQRLSYF